MIGTSVRPAWRWSRRICRVAAKLDALPEPEGSPSSFFAVETDFAVHALRQFADDHQPQAGAAELAGRRIVALREGGEQLFASRV
jgi:hypothetical protein